MLTRTVDQDTMPLLMPTTCFVAAPTDPTREIAVAYGMIDPDLKDAEGLPLTCRSVFIIGPDKKLKLSLK